MSGRLENEQKINKTIQRILLTLPVGVSLWNANLEASGNTAQTRYVYVRKISGFINFITDNPQRYNFNKLSKVDVINYLQSIRTKEKDGEIVSTSDSYRNSTWHCLNNFLEFLYTEKIIKENYIKGIKKGKNHDLDRINEKRILLTEKDLTKIVQAVEHETQNNKFGISRVSMYNRNVLIFLILITTGVRVTALTEIDISDINIEEKTLRVTDKGNKYHVYYLTDKTVYILDEWLCDRENILEYSNISSKALFINSYGERMTDTGIRKLVEKYTKIAIGKSLSPHKLRAAFVSTIYNRTHDIEFVRRAVGHSNVATTQRYIVTDRTERKQSAEIMSSALKL